MWPEDCDTESDEVWSLGRDYEQEEGDNTCQFSEGSAFSLGLGGGGKGMSFPRSGWKDSCPDPCPGGSGDKDRPWDRPH